MYYYSYSKYLGILGIDKWLSIWYNGPSPRGKRGIQGSPPSRPTLCPGYLVEFLPGAEYFYYYISRFYPAMVLARHDAYVWAPLGYLRTRRMAIRLI